MHPIYATPLFLQLPGFVLLLIVAFLSKSYSFGVGQAVDFIVVMESHDL